MAKLDGLTEVDAISDAIIETEREIAGEAWGQEETERDDSGRALEQMGDGLEGQHESEDDQDAEGEESEGDEESKEEVVAEGDKKPEVVAEAGKDGEAKPEPVREKGNVPSGMLREANERARIAETERDALKAELAKTGQTLEQKLDAVTRELAEMRRAPALAPKPAEPPKPEVVPDMFEDPKGFAEHLTKGFQTELSKRDQQIANQRVETSMAIAHAFHKDTFEKAFAAVNKLNVQNPEDRLTVQRIYGSPNPGEALVSWHKRAETLALVGDDPTKYAERIRTETREALMKDPEFRKALIADLRGDAAREGRTTTRVPPSLHRAQGSNVGADRGDARELDDSDTAVAEAAWR